MHTDNPYAAPQAAVGPPEAADRRPPPGELARALAGDHRMDLAAVMGDAAKRVRGGILAANGLALCGLLTMLGLWWGFLSVADPGTLADLLSDAPEAKARAAEGLARPDLGFASVLVLAPFTSAFQLVTWRLALQRATKDEVSLIGAIELDGLGSLLAATLGTSLLVWLLGWLLPFGGLIAYPLNLATFWVAPLIVDRGMGAWPAIVTSVRLTRWNLLPMLGLGLVLGMSYLLGFAACFLGLLLFFPWTVSLLGSTWRQLCGLDRVTRAPWRGGFTAPSS